VTRPGRRGTGPGAAFVVVGDLVTDVLVTYDRPVEPGSDTAAAITVAGGGQAANTAAWLAHAGRAVTLAAAVGDDAAGRERVAELAAAGVRCAVAVRPGAATGSVVVLSSGGERSMFADPGAARRLDPGEVAAAVAAPGAGHLHVSGYVLLDPGSRPAGLAALAAARERGLPASVDAASAGPLRRAGAAAFLSWVRDADLLLCNAAEAAVLGGPGGPGAQAAALAAGVREVVVKLGAGGALWCGRDGVLRSAAAVPVPLVEPTGAGDAFAAALLAAWSCGADRVGALAAATVAGAAAVRRVGGRP
jgi:ribokinase